MEFKLKHLPPEGITAAKKKAEHYRLLNEPRQAESICLDILEVIPDDPEVLVLLLLARTDQFTKDVAARVNDARELLMRLKTDYDRSYYAGVICERWAKAQLTRNNPGSGHHVYAWLREAMQHYEAAQELDVTAADPVLRWNACARLIRRHDHLEEAPEEDFSPLLE